MYVSTARSHRRKPSAVPRSDGVASAAPSSNSPASCWAPRRRETSAARSRSPAAASSGAVIDFDRWRARSTGSSSLSASTPCVRRRSSGAAASYKAEASNGWVNATTEPATTRATSASLAASRADLSWSSATICCNCATVSRPAADTSKRTSRAWCGSRATRSWRRSTSPGGTGRTGSWPACALPRQLDTSACMVRAISRARNGFPPLARATPAVRGGVHRVPRRFRSS